MDSSACVGELEPLDRRRRTVGEAMAAGGLVRRILVIGNECAVLVVWVTPELSAIRCFVICVSKRPT